MDHLNNLKELKNVNVQQHLDKVLKENPDWPRTIFAASYVPCLWVLLKRTENLGLLSAMKLATSCIAIGASVRLSYMYNSGEFKNTRKYTEKDLIDNKALILGSAVNVGSYVAGPVGGFVFSFISLGCEGAAVGYRYYRMNNPLPVQQQLPNSQSPKSQPSLIHSKK